MPAHLSHLPPGMGEPLKWLLGISRLIKITKDCENCGETAGEKGHTREVKLFLREGSFLNCSFVFSSDCFYFYAIMWEKGIGNELQSPGEEVLKEHSNRAQENLKLRTMKADVSI